MTTTPYDARVRFGADRSGNQIAYRPDEVLVRVNADDVATIQLIYVQLAEKVRPKPQAHANSLTQIPGTDLDMLHRRIDNNWAVLRLLNGVDPFEVLELIGDLLPANRPPIQAQLNHVYFINSLEASAQFNPNYLAPNYLAPNYLAPNYLAPNYLAPNYLAPNYLAPNYLAPNYLAPNYLATGGHAAGCGCKQCPDAPGTPTLVPKLSARKAWGPVPGPPVVVDSGDGFDLQIHVLDVRPQVRQVDQLDDAAAEAIVVAEGQKNLRLATEERATRKSLAEQNGAVLPAALALVDELQDPTNEYDGVKQAYKLEPLSPGLGADVNTDGWVDPVTNHGVFIKGIVDRLVVKASGRSAVVNHSIAGTEGVVDDEDLARSLDYVDALHGPKATGQGGANPDPRRRFRIMSLSLSGYTADDKPEGTLAEKVKKLQANGWLIVAAAGNNASCRLAWPAALPGVISVSAFGSCGPAWFSNFGPWVDACAPGVDIVSNFPDIESTNQALSVDEATPATSFNTGFARWSGTSFAAPYVAAIIARWIKRNRPGVLTTTAYSAAKKALILDPNAPRIPGYGTIVSEELTRVQTTVSDI